MREVEADDAYAELRRRQEGGAEAMLRPASETPEDVAQLFEEHRLHRQMARERAGEGGEPVEAFGMLPTSPNDTPEGAFNTSTWFGPNERDEEVEAFWGGATLIDLPPDQALRTGQSHVSPTALAQLDLPTSGSVIDWHDSRPRVVRVEGQMWVVDGHHRIARARREGLAVRVLLTSYEQAVADGWFDALLDREE